MTTTTPEETRKRRRWISWIPAVLLAVLVIAAIVTSVLLVRSGLGEPAPEPTEGQVSDLNWSSFTEEGIAFIQRSREIRIDLSDKAEDAATLGLPADGTITIGPHSEGLDYKFTFNGGGAGLGGDMLIVSELTITTENGILTEIAAPLSQVDGFRATLNELDQQSQLFGWDMSFVDDLYDRVGQANDDGVGYEFTAGPADLIGVPVAAVAQCDASNFCVVTYVITPTSG